VSTRNGSGGAATRLASSSSSLADSPSASLFALISACVSGAPSPFVSGVIWFGSAAPP
jgi:hypothetical protein